MKNTKFLIMAIAAMLIFAIACTEQPETKNDVTGSVQNNANEQPADNTPAETQPTDTVPEDDNSAPGADDTASSVKEFTVVAKNWVFEPGTITVNKGDTVKMTVTSIDVAHGFALPDFGVNERLEAGEEVTIEFVADKTGEFTFFCNVFCGSGHREMKGKLVVN